MKYCVSSRQPKSFLAQADEIKIPYADKDRLIDYVKEFKDKTIILTIPKEVHNHDLNWDLFRAYSEEVDFILCIDNLGLAKDCRAQNIKFYWSYPAFTWYELRSLVALNPCQIFLTAPLSFDLEKVKKITSIPLRLCPNLAHDSYIPRENGIYGPWIRPEDVKEYEVYVDVLEFITDDLGKERTLLHVYKDNGNWPGNLNLLLTNFNINVDNRGIPEEIGKNRMTCGQRCMQGGNCHFCETAIKFSNAVRSKHYRDNKVSPIASEEES